MALAIPERGELVARGVDVSAIDHRAARAAELASDNVDHDWSADNFPTTGAARLTLATLRAVRAQEARRAVYLLALEECFR